MSDALIVYGRSFSPYTRRVLIWARLQGRAVDHRPIQVMGDDFARLKDLTPAGRVPLVQLPDGRNLTESWAICDWLESTAPLQARLLPQEPGPRADAMQALACAHTAIDKTVAYVYETQRRPADKVWPDWADRLRGQALGALSLLEARAPAAGLFGGDAPNAADIGAATALDFIAAAVADDFGPPPPKLAATTARTADLPAFAETNPRAS